MLDTNQQAGSGIISMPLNQYVRPGLLCASITKLSRFIFRICFCDLTFFSRTGAERTQPVCFLPFTRKLETEAQVFLQPNVVMYR